jgi:hypothetical protein
MFSPMQRNISLCLLALVAALGITACADTEKKPAGPVSTSSQIPWNTPIAGQGQGQMGMMPQNQYRR